MGIRFFFSTTISQRTLVSRYEYEIYFKLRIIMIMAQKGIVFKITTTYI